MSEILKAYVKMIFATTSKKIMGLWPPPLIFQLIYYEGPMEEEQRRKDLLPIPIYSFYLERDDHSVDGRLLNDSGLFHRDLALPSPSSLSLCSRIWVGFG